MLACIACSKRLNGGSLDAADDDRTGSNTPRSPASREAIKNITSQIKDMALKFSGSYRYCKPVAASNLSREGHVQRCMESEAGSEGVTPRGGSSSSTPAWNVLTTAKGDVLRDSNSSSNTTPKLYNGLGPGKPIEEEEESKEWTSMVEPGVIITLLSLKGGGNELKRIRFSREMFDKFQAQRWWTENHENIMELYNVRPAKRESADLPFSQEEEESKRDCAMTTPPQSMSLFPKGLYASTETSCRDEDRSNDLQCSSANQSPNTSTNSSEQDEDEGEEEEWVEEDEPGVYITIHSSASGVREVKRVRFSREKFSEMQARLWWEDNRYRIQEQYIYEHM